MRPSTGGRAAPDQGLRAKRKPVSAIGSVHGLSGSPSGGSGMLNSRGPVSLGVSGWKTAARYWMWSRPTPSSDCPPP